MDFLPEKKLTSGFAKIHWSVWVHLLLRSTSIKFCNFTKKTPLCNSKKLKNENWHANIELHCQFCIQFHSKCCCTVTLHQWQSEFIYFHNFLTRSVHKFISFCRMRSKHKYNYERKMCKQAYCHPKNLIWINGKSDTSLLNGVKSWLEKTFKIIS